MDLDASAFPESLVNNESLARGFHMYPTQKKHWNPVELQPMKQFPKLMWHTSTNEHNNHGHPHTRFVPISLLSGYAH